MEYIYGVVPIVMSGVGKAVRVIAGYNKEGDSDWVPSLDDPSKPFDTSKKFYGLGGLDWMLDTPSGLTYNSGNLKELRRRRLRTSLPRFARSSRRTALRSLRRFPPAIESQG